MRKFLLCAFVVLVAVTLVAALVAPAAEARSAWCDYASYSPAIRIYCLLVAAANIWMYGGDGDGISG